MTGRRHVRATLRAHAFLHLAPAAFGAALCAALALSSLMSGGHAP